MPRDKEARKFRVLRHTRVRRKVSGTPHRPRLCVFRSNGDIYVQIIDDVAGTTLESASSLQLKRQDSTQTRAKTEWSKLVGAEVARKALAKGITRVVFDRGGYLFHGRIKALAEAAREEGLEF